MTITHRSISVRAARAAGASGLTLCSLLLIACGGGTNPPPPPPPPPANPGPPTAGYVQLQVSASGDGSGLIVSDPAGITCTVTAGAATGTCGASFLVGTAVTLTATGAFSAWYGPCSGSAAEVNCTLSLTPGGEVVYAGFGTITSLTAIFALGAGSGESTMGLVDIGLPTFLLRAASPPATESRARVSSATTGAGKPTLTVSARLRVLGRDGSVALSGTYDLGSRQLCLLQAPVGTADPCVAPSTTVWQFKGIIDSTGSGSGAISGPDPNTPGASAPGLFRVQNNRFTGSVSSRYSYYVRRSLWIFCGHFRDASQRELGQWVVTLIGLGKIGGLASQGAAFYGIANGPPSGIILTSQRDGAAVYNATSTLSADGFSIGGTWSSTNPAGGPSGTWGATTAGCQ